MHNSAQLRCFENGNDDFGVEAFWIGDAARVGYFVPLNGPLNGHPPSIVVRICVCMCVRVLFVLHFALGFYVCLYELGVRSLANASRARQFNPLNPPGVGWVNFFIYFLR